MRTSTLFLAFLLAACGDNYAAVQKADTIEAYEAYLAENPDAGRSVEAAWRLEELYLQKATDGDSEELWANYFERYPAGNVAEEARKRHQNWLVNNALRSGASKDWKALLEAYPSPPKTVKSLAKSALEASTFAEQYIQVGDITQGEVNMAEEENGPMDGVTFTAPITYTGETPLEAFWFRIQYLDEQGHIVGHNKWPVVAPRFPGSMPEEAKLPMAQGETRTWEWWIGKEELPKDFSGNVRLMALAVSVAE